MSLYHEDFDSYHPDFPKEDEATLSKKRQIKKRLEEKLEARRIREYLDDYDEEFDWSQYK